MTTYKSSEAPCNFKKNIWKQKVRKESDKILDGQTDNL